LLKDPQTNGKPVQPATCVGAVTSELSVLAGVTDVQIDLVVDGTSTLTVTTDKDLADDELAIALDEAGEYKLASV
jgi:copper chaperone